MHPLFLRTTAADFRSSWNLSRCRWLPFPDCQPCILLPWGESRLTLALDYLHRHAIASVDRGYSRSADQQRHGGSDVRSPFPNPGTVQPLDTGEVLAVQRNGAFGIGLNANGQTINRFDTSRFGS